MKTVCIVGANLCVHPGETHPLPIHAHTHNTAPLLSTSMMPPYILSKP